MMKQINNKATKSEEIRKRENRQTNNITKWNKQKTKKKEKKWLNEKKKKLPGNCCFCLFSTNKKKLHASTYKYMGNIYGFHQ